MADRDLNTQSQALLHVLARLQNDVRILKSRAAFPGAARLSGWMPEGSPLTVVTTTASTNHILTEMDVDPGRWVIFASAEYQADGDDFTGRDVASIFVQSVDSAGTAKILSKAVWAPYCTPRAAIPVEEARNTLVAIGSHLSPDQPARLQLRGHARDQASNVHVCRWEYPQLIAMPV